MPNVEFEYTSVGVKIGKENMDVELEQRGRTFQNLSLKFLRYLVAWKVEMETELFLGFCIYSHCSLLILRCLKVIEKFVRLGEDLFQS